MVKGEVVAYIVAWLWGKPTSVIHLTVTTADRESTMVDLLNLELSLDTTLQLGTPRS